MVTRTLILHCDIVKDGSVLLHDRYITIENRCIAATGHMCNLADTTADLVIDGREKLAVPGLINGHTHSPMTLFRGMADDLQLSTWLEEYIFPAEASHVSAEMVYWCSKLAAAEMMLSGTTCIADGYFFSDHSARAFSEAGLRAVVGHGIVDFPAPGVPDPSKNISVVAEFISKWKNRSELITPAVFAHSAYTCSPQTLQRAKKLADDNDVRFFIHLAETSNEQERIIEPAAKTPLQHLVNLGIVDDNCILIHANWLDDADLDTLAASGAHVISCPQSNFKLASGKCPAAAMMSRGLQPGLGTDSSASNNSLDMFCEMDVFAKSQKVFHKNPTLFPAETVFSMATANNNKILGFDTKAAIEPGSRADVLLLDLHSPHLTPFYNQDLLVYGARGSDVAHVIIDGRVVVRDRVIQTFDALETMSKVRDLAQPLQQKKTAK